MAIDASIDLTIPGHMWEQLRAHLFRADRDEHGAVIAAGVSKIGNEVRLLARELFLAKDGVDYVPGQRGYRMLTANFVRDQALHCRDEGLAYLAIHNHGGHDRVSFSSDDLHSHERGYPALQAITRGQIVGGLVFAQAAVAGDIWIGPDRLPLRRARILGSSFTYLYPAPPSRPIPAGPTHDRQARLFGDRGQQILAEQRVGVVGLGGIGSLVAEYLARLGVGELVLVDPDRLEASNLSRVVNSGPEDIGDGRAKVAIAGAGARRANSAVRVEEFDVSVTSPAAAAALTTCDYLFLAADTMQARLLFNALVHQFLVPGVQLGAKVPVDGETGDVLRPFSVVRYVSPETGCLMCNGLISAARLAEEALTPEERRAQRYVDEPEVVAPSVITFNAVAAAHAVNDYLLRTMGLRDDVNSSDYFYVEPRQLEIRYELPRRDPECPECGDGPASRRARGDAARLPTSLR